MAQLGSIEAKMLLDIANFMQNMDKASKKMNETANNSNSKLANFGSKLTSAGATMTKSVTAPILGFAGASTKMAMDTEKGFAKVNSIAQLSGKEWTDYTKQMKSGASSTGKTYSEYAEATYSAISAGVKYTDTTKFLDNANKLAVGGFTDLSKSTDVLTTIQNAYGLSAKDTAHISDVLIQTQNKGKTTVDELASNMGKVIPTAQSLGVGVEQLGASYAIMTAKGIATAESTTYMNSMFNEMGKSGTVVDKTLKEISGKSFKELTAEGKTTGDVLQMLDDHAKANGLSLSDMFGSAEAGKAAMTLLGNGADEFNAQLKGMNESTGATKTAFDTVSNTAEGKMKRAFADMKNAMSDFGEAMVPVVTWIATMVGKFLEWASAMMNNHPWISKITLAVMGLLAIIGPILLTLGGLITAITSISTALPIVLGALTTMGTFIKGKLIATIISLNMTLTANPIGIVIVAIGALVGAFVLLWNKCDWFRDFWINLWEAMKQAFFICIDWIKQKFNDFISFLGAIPQNFKNFVDSSVKFISELPGKVWDWLKKTIDKTLQWADQMINKAIDASANFVGKFIAGIIQFPGRVWNLLVTVVTKVEAWKARMWQMAIEIGTKFVTNFIQFLKELPGKTWEWLVNTIQKFLTWRKNVQDHAKEAGKTLVTNFINFVKELPSKMWTWLQQTISKLASWVIDMGRKGTEGAKRLGTNIWNGMKSIPSQMYNIGSNIVEGVWKGISGAGNWLYNKVSRFASGVVDSMKNALGIHSPSRVMRDQIGKFIPQGLSVGIEAEENGVFSKLRNMSSNMVDTLHKSLDGANLPSALSFEGGVQSLYDNAPASVVNNTDSKRVYNITIGEFNNNNEGDVRRLVREINTNDDAELLMKGVWDI